MEELELKNLIANNIVKYRKEANLTQLELAEKLNYSDKAISKWERAEAIPDIYVLKQLADIFKISVNDFLCYKPASKIYLGISIEKRIIIPLMAGFLICLIATIVFGFLVMLSAPIERPWLCFIFAIPAVCISSLVFCAIWKKLFLLCFFTSALTWSLALILFLLIALPNKFIFFIFAIPAEIIIILWYILISISRKRKGRK